MRWRGEGVVVPPWLIAATATLVAVLVLVAVVVSRRGYDASVATPPITVTSSDPALNLNPTTDPVAPAPSSDEPAPSDSSESPSPTDTPSPSPSQDPEEAALAQLETLRQQDLQSVVMQGQWVAQLASKTPGIVDPKQTTQSGSHTFTAVDILAEHVRLRHGSNHGATVILLKSTDYGQQQLYNGEPLWVTFAVANFSSAANVHSWCVRRFPTLHGDQLENVCTPRHLDPP